MTTTPPPAIAKRLSPPLSPSIPLKKTRDKRLESPSSEREWEEYHPSQDEESVDGSISRASASGSRVGTPIAKTRTRQGTRAGVESPTARRTATPMMRRKAQQPVQSPKVREAPITIPASRRESRSQPSGPTVRKQQTNDIPAIVNYLLFVGSTLFSILQRTILFGVSIMSTLLAPYLLPLFLGLSGIIIAGLSAYFLLPLLPSFLVNVVARGIRTIIPGASWSISTLSNLGITRSAAIVPARVLVTPACTLLGIGCQYSLLSMFRPDPIQLEMGENGEYEVEGGRVARPFWEWNWSAVVPNLNLGMGGSRRAGVDVAGVARGLGREVKQARDIFESVQSMSSAGLVRNLHYVKIWELGVAVSVGSKLEGKEIVGRELTDLGDLTRDLADEISAIDYAAVNAFTWIQWEFATLLELLNSPNPPSNATLASRLHSLISQLDTAFTELHTLTTTATDTATLASDKGSRLWSRLTTIRYSLLSEKERDPIWRQAWDKNKHRLVGGEVPRSEMLERDLRLTSSTIEGLGDAKEHLERVRVLTKGYRDQIGMTQARMTGFHLGAEGVMEAEEEVRVLGRLVEGLGDAVGEAKRRAKSGKGAAKKGYLEIEG